MTAFLEDPRLRQRWNQISHNAEAVTENAAVGIWTFQHTYVTPCLSSLGEAVDSCTSVCLGDREERARRQRERERGVHRSLAEYSFDFYDDWYDDYNDVEASGAASGAGAGTGGSASGAGTIGSIFGRGFFGTWGGSRAEDWDRLVAGSGGGGGGSSHGGAARHRSGDSDGTDDHGPDGAGDEHHAIVDQPRRRRGMSYGTRGLRRFVDDDDPTIIPSTAPLGFLGRLPFKIGGTLRYKPSAANLREQPSGRTDGKKRGGRNHDKAVRDEHEPLLGRGDGARHDATDAEHGHGGGSGGHDRHDGHDGHDSSNYESHGGEANMDEQQWQEALLMSEGQMPANRKRSGTTGTTGTARSGDTSDSYRSRGDLFPSDEEGDEDAVPLDDEFAVALDRADDRSSGRTRLSSSSSLMAGGVGGTATMLNPGWAVSDSRGPLGGAAAAGPLGGRHKGKRRADTAGSGRSSGLSRSVSYTTIGTMGSVRSAASVSSLRRAGAASPEQLRREEARAAQEEDEEVERKRRAAARLAHELGLAGRPGEAGPGQEVEAAAAASKMRETEPELEPEPEPAPGRECEPESGEEARGAALPLPEDDFVPARLPHFR